MRRLLISGAIMAVLGLGCSTRQEEYATQSQPANVLYDDDIDLGVLESLKARLEAFQPKPVEPETLPIDLDSDTYLAYSLFSAYKEKGGNAEGLRNRNYLEGLDEIYSDYALVDLATSWRGGRFPDFMRAVKAATYRGWVRNDRIYKELVDSLEGEYPGLLACATDHPETARATSCQKSIAALKQAHYGMNLKRERRGLFVIPVSSVWHPQNYNP